MHFKTSRSHRANLDKLSPFRGLRRRFSGLRGKSMSASVSQPGAIDGTTQPDTLTRKATESPHRNDICCIFVHAGAGYHSHANEKIHLEACNEYVVWPFGLNPSPLEIPADNKPPVRHKLPC